VATGQVSSIEKPNEWGTDRYTPRHSCQTDRTQLVTALNQLRGETDMGVVADVILSIGFRLER